MIHGINLWGNKLVTCFFFFLFKHSIDNFYLKVDAIIFYMNSLCITGYLAARRYMDGIINTVLLMLESGSHCFSRGDPIGNLRKRFHPEMSECEAANYMIHVSADAYNKWTTFGYDMIHTALRSEVNLGFVFKCTLLFVILFL